ncbi:hypothetical protein APR08_006532 [Nocardia amikacinitolerans]|nr:hypothetical protein [Nocardia amikacinitolerans]
MSHLTRRVGAGSQDGQGPIRHAPLYVLALAVGVTALVFAGLPVVVLLWLQVVLACPLLMLVLIGNGNGATPPSNSPAPLAEPASPTRPYGSTRADRRFGIRGVAAPPWNKCFDARIVATVTASVADAHGVRRVGT